VSLHIWDSVSGQPRAALRGHGDAIDWIAFAPDSHIIFSASRDATVKLWDADAAPGVPSGVRFQPPLSAPIEIPAAPFRIGF
jgi:WD40 repeat protein